jgi:hypothetical protein
MTHLFHQAILSDDLSVVNALGDAVAALILASAEMLPINHDSMILQ